MSPVTARWITWTGGLAILGGAVLALALNLVYADSVFAARLVAGLAGCL